MSAPLHVAVLGAGYFAQFHIEAWQRHPQTDLIDVADANIARAQATGTRAFESLADMLQAVQPDIIDIATPPSTHAQAILQALAFKPKAIICQKPFCTSYQEAKKVAQSAMDVGVPLIVHENFRFQPWYREIKKSINDNALGDIHQVMFRLRTGDGQGPEAYLDRQPYFRTMPRLLVHETAVHWVDTFRYLLGDIEGVYADLRHLNPSVTGEDAGHILFHFADGKRALFDGNRHLNHAAQNHRLTLGEALVEGTAGTLRLTGMGNVMHRSFGHVVETCVLPAQPWQGFAGDCVYALQSHVISGLLVGTKFENTAMDYLIVRRIEDAIYQSATEWRFVETPI